ncbi:MAG: hypothetical protein ACFC1C_00150 [Candidatus Malihini olakiniferum]
MPNTVIVYDMPHSYRGADKVLWKVIVAVTAAEVQASMLPYATAFNENRHGMLVRICNDMTSVAKRVPLTVLRMPGALDLRS